MRSVLIAAAIVTTFIFGVVQPAAASVVLAPSKIEMQVKPGELTSFTVGLKNGAAGALTVEASTWDFARDADGVAQPIAAGDTDTFHGCSAWLDLPSQVGETATGKMASVPVAVQVPRDARAGSYFTYVRLLASPTSDRSDGVGISYDLSALVVLTVVPEGAAAVGLGDAPLLDRTVSVGGVVVPVAAVGESVPLKATLINSGNVHANVRARFEVLDGGGHVVDSIPLSSFTLLPGDRFPLSGTWTKPPLVGNYTARFVAEQAGGETLMKDASFWILSWTLIGAALGGLLVLGVVGLLFRKFVHVEIRRADAHPAAR